MRLRRCVAPAVVLLALLAPAEVQSQSGPPGRTRVGELREEARRTASSIEAARKQLDEAVTGYEQARSRMAQASIRLRQARERLEATAAAYQEERDRMRRRAAALYKGEGMQVIDALLASRSLDSLMRRLTFLSSVAERDVRRAEELEARQQEEALVREAVEAEAAAVHAEMRTMSGRSEEIMGRLRILHSSLSRVSKALKVELSKWRFPVLPPYSYIDSFGAPRMTGTSYEHSHEGQDIFAASGTPVVAVVSGVVNGVGTAPLGGIKLWLQGDDGHKYYYAHLSGYAPAGREGALVEAGTELGYVGATGNARGTPPHLHFEMHGPQGVINPYQTLRNSESGWTGG